MAALPSDPAGRAISTICIYGILNDKHSTPYTAIFSHKICCSSSPFFISFLISYSVFAFQCPQPVNQLPCCLMKRLILLLKACILLLVIIQLCSEQLCLLFPLAVLRFVTCHPFSPSVLPDIPDIRPAKTDNLWNIRFFYHTTDIWFFHAKSLAFFDLFPGSLLSFLIPALFFSSRP